MGQEIIPMAEFRPDMPDLAEATSIATNVVPMTPESYGPVASLTAYSSSAMDSTCIGAFACQSGDLATLMFAGTTDKLYRMTATAPTWNDVSGASYSTAPGDVWEFDLFDTDTLVVTNFGDAVQSFSLSSSATFGPLFTGTAWALSTAYSTIGEMQIAGGNRYILTQPGTSASTGTGPSGTGSGIADGTCIWNYQSGAPPQARHLCMPKNFCMLANTYDPVGGYGPQRIWWSAAGDATTWPAPGTNAAIEGMSDYNDFEGYLGQITGIWENLANADVAIFFQHAIWRGLFVGPPTVFDFFPTENASGCPAPNSIVPIGAKLWYLGEDGFYTFDGISSTPIGDTKFDAWFFANVNLGYLGNVIGDAYVPGKTIYWAFPSVNSVNGVCDSILVYRWDIQRASYINAGAENIDWLMRALSWGFTMDGMPAAGYPDVDTLPASLDSAVWIGGVLQITAVNGSHQLAYFTGPNMAAQVATQTKQLTPGRRTIVQSARPLVDLTSGTPSVAFAARVNLYDAEVFGAAVTPNVAGECPQRSDGRYHNAMVEIAAGAIWDHIVGVEVTYVPGGTR